MVGDFRGLLRSLNFYKAFAAYNMVLIHGVSIMHPILAPLGFVESGHLQGSMLRGFFSMTLPVFGGLYLRHLLGPYLAGGRLTQNILPQLKKLFVGAFILEGIRLYTISFDVGWIFSWQVLHFIVLATLITCLSLRSGSRALFWVLGIDVILAFILPLWSDSTTPFIILNQSNEIFAKCGMSLLLGLVFTAGTWMWKRNAIFSAASFVMGATVMILFGFRDPLNQESFLNLPVNIWFPIKGTRNFWPFLSFYPLFLSGYFFRDFFFDLKNKKLFLPLSGFIAVCGILGFYFGFHGVSIGTENALNAEIFRRGIPGTAFLICVFYFSWIFFYYLLRKMPFKIFDRFSRVGGNVLTLYIIHTFLYVLLREFLESQGDSTLVPGGLFGMYVLLHGVYVLSVFLSYNLVKHFNSRLQG